MIKQFYPANNFNKLVFRAYDHSDVDKQYINKEAEAKIKEFFDLGLTKPDQIIRNLRAQNVPEPPKQKIKYFLAKLRKSTSQTILNLHEVENWVKANQLIPESGNFRVQISHSFKLHACTKC